MALYTYETYILTTGDLLMKAQGVATEFSVEKFKFIKSDIQPEHGRRYIVRFQIQANGWADVFSEFNRTMIDLEDALAFYYSMPVIWEWWLFTLKREQDTDNRIVVSLYKDMPGVSMESYDGMPENEIIGIIKLLQSNDKFADALHYYNSLCRVDTIELSRVHLAVAFQLVDSIAEQEDVKGCKVCGRADYKRVSRDDVKLMLGEKLYKDLYINKEGSEQTARNATMHGNSNSKSLSPITMGHIEEVLVKVRERLITKYNLDRVANAKNRVDVARYFFTREGTRIAVEILPQATLDTYYKRFIDNDLKYFKVKSVGSDW